jgi:hypothetical protein
MSVLKTKEFMFKDLNTTISLVKSKGSAPNFLLALGLCCYTEFWGRLIKGSPIKNEEDCFNEFFDRLGPCYKKLQNNSHFQPYKDIRSSLVHAYLDKEITIALREGPCGILFNPAKKTYTFYIKTYLKDFGKAVDDYIEELHNNVMAVKNMEKAFRNKVSLT